MGPGDWYMARKALRPRVVISRCIEFENVRWNAQIIRSEFVEALIPHVEEFTVCPEVGIGLGVPRETLRLVDKGDGVRLMQPATGEDLTDRMTTFLDDFIAGLPEVDGFILKSRSPTSGLRRVKIYPSLGKVAHIRRGPGLFGGIVRERFGHLALEDEGRLRNGRIREHFLRKLYTLARFREARERGGFGDLLEFHIENKLLLKAYRERDMRGMGRIVANEGRLPPGVLFGEYEPLLHSALRRPPRCGTYINALMNSLGYFSKNLTGAERQFFLNSLQRYKEGKVPLVVPVDIMRSWIVRFGEEYLARQAFFNPYPEELMDVEAIVEACGGRDYWEDVA